VSVKACCKAIKEGDFVTNHIPMSDQQRHSSMSGAAAKRYLHKYQLVIQRLDHRIQGCYQLSLGSQ